LELYQQALAAEPDRQQRLHVLFRMAQLQSCAYRVENGETPNYPQAIRLYQQILASYPAEEPLVLQATTGVADCYVSVRRFDEALYWSRKALTADTKVLEERLKALENGDGPDHAQVPAGNEQPPADPDALRRTLRQMQRTQCAAVDQIAYAATQVSSLWAETQLKAIEEQYAGTSIARRARELLERNADQVSDALAPSRHLPPASEGSTFQSAVPAASTSPRTGAAGLPASLPTTPSLGAGGTLGPGRAERPLAEQIPSRSPRGPPLTRTWRVIAGVAGLALAVLAARRLLRGSLRKG
jgi:hypothetical protein